MSFSGSGLPSPPCPAPVRSPAHCARRSKPISISPAAPTPCRTLRKPPAHTAPASSSAPPLCADPPRATPPPSTRRSGMSAPRRSPSPSRTPAALPLADDVRPRTPPGSATAAAPADDAPTSTADHDTAGCGSTRLSRAPSAGPYSAARSLDSLVFEPPSPSPHAAFSRRAGFRF